MTNYKKLLSFACLGNIIFSSSVLTADDAKPKDKSFIEHATNQYMNASFGLEKPVEIIPLVDITQLGPIAQIKEALLRRYDTKIYTISKREAHTITNQLATQQKNRTTKKQNIVDFPFIDKLEIVSGANNENLGLFECTFSHIHTLSGKSKAFYTIINPTTNIKILNHRQKAISLIGKDKSFIKNAHQALSSIAKSEPFSLQTWSETPPVNELLLKKFYFRGPLKGLNTSSLALEATNKTYDVLQVTGSVVGSSCLKVAGSYLFSNYYLGKKITIKESAQANWDLFTSPEIPLAMKAMLYYDLLFIPFNLYTATMSLNSTNEISSHLHKGLVSSAKHIKALKKLSSLVNRNKTLLKCLPSLQPLADFNNPAKLSSNMNKLIGLLESSTLNGEYSFFSISGRIFAAYELMKQVKEELAPVFAAAGELDMYVALAKLYSSRDGKEARYCMVDFVENSPRPIIKAQGFWNPFIDPKNVVINSARFDSSCPNSILTGPNTGGKSTIIKALMIDVLLAQTFGITAAQSFTITPFAKLNCFMNISDDIATGASLFKSEVMRAKKLLDMVQGLTSNEFSFVIIDEVFTGTSPQEGEAAALKFAEKLGSYPNNISIIATHYPKMTTLEETTNGLFKNHHIEILRNEDGSLNRTFKFKTGPTFFNVAFDILEEEGLFV